MRSPPNSASASHSDFVPRRSRHPVRRALTAGTVLAPSQDRHCPFLGNSPCSRLPLELQMQWGPHR
ncbi:uncharacterized protein COLE_00011 [Cutaneotrichosporon oleaginosum]|nr:hypothetical protein COLE_00011 [Cutaneotrichosporon oleaginosum]